MTSRNASDTQYGGIHGEVNLWGSVVEHEGGFRLQFAFGSGGKRFRFLHRRVQRLNDDFFGLSICIIAMSPLLMLRVFGSGRQTTFACLGASCRLTSSSQTRHLRMPPAITKNGLPIWSSRMGAADDLLCSPAIRLLCSRLVFEFWCAHARSRISR
jgi:hypothetical protein